MNSATTDAAFETTVRAAIGGDADAFGVLVRRYAGLVTGVAYSILSEFDRSEDAGQDAFLEAWKNRDRLADPAKFPSWICSIARHRALDIARRSTQKSQPITVTLMPEPVAPAEDASSDIGEEEKQIVWDALHTLPETYREAMVLYYRGNQSVAAVAEALGQSEATVRKRLQRGREQLRAHVLRMVDRTLTGTAPRSLFIAAVLGSLPGNAYAAAALATGTGKAASFKTAVVAKSGMAGLSAPMVGGLLGALGGVAGSAIGAYCSYRSSPYPSQRRIIVAIFIVSMLEMAVFMAWIFWLVSVQSSPDALPPAEYGNRVSISIVGFQALLMATIFGGLWFHRRAGRFSKQAGEPVNSDYKQCSLSGHPGQAYQSSKYFLGLPLVDVCFQPRDESGAYVGEPRWARGWLAFGDRAVSPFFASGSVAIAPIAMGGLGLGLISVGGVTIGVLTAGGIAIGLMATGGVAAGGVAIGGLAAGYYVLGGLMFGLHHLDPHLIESKVAVCLFLVLVVGTPLTVSTIQKRLMAKRVR